MPSWFYRRAHWALLTRDGSLLGPLWFTRELPEWGDCRVALFPTRDAARRAARLVGDLRPVRVTLRFELAGKRS